MIRLFRDEKGQALAEWVVSLPLLLLLASGLFQFTLLFLARIQFDHACGGAVRRWASGDLREETLPDVVWNGLGFCRAWFDRSSLRLENGEDAGGHDAAQARREVMGPSLGGALASAVQKVGLAYEYRSWRISIRYKSRPFFGVTGTQGLRFQCDLAAIQQGRDLP